MRRSLATSLSSTESAASLAAIASRLGVDAVDGPQQRLGRGERPGGAGVVGVAAPGRALRCPGRRLAQPLGVAEALPLGGELPASSGSGATASISDSS